MDSEFLEENNERSIDVKRRDKRSCKVIKNIQDLDVSMQELDAQLKMIRAESLDFHLKNCEELKDKLATEPPESESLARNTQQFLQLFDTEETNEEICDKSYVKCRKNIRCQKLEEPREPQISMSITDEEKQRLNSFTNDVDDSENEKNCEESNAIVEIPLEINPYSIDETSKKLLKELEDKLEKLDRQK